MKTAQTDLLDIAYLDDGPAEAPVALLLHGWPDDVHGMTPLADRLRERGYRTITPWLRGFGRPGSGPMTRSATDAVSP